MSAGVCAGALVAIGARPDEAQYALHDAFEKALARNEQVGRPEGWLFVVASRLWRQHRVRAAIFSPLSLLAKSVVVADTAGRSSDHRGRPAARLMFFQAAYLTRVSLEEQ
jgi:DNA-directed RNA polymerase specialized sigma24 family protein